MWNDFDLLNFRKEEEKEENALSHLPPNLAEMQWRTNQDLAAENYMMSMGPGFMFPYGPPQRGLADLAMRFNAGQRKMSREDIEARKADFKRKNEMERSCIRLILPTLHSAFYLTSYFSFVNFTFLLF